MASVAIPTSIYVGIFIDLEANKFVVLVVTSGAIGPFFIAVNCAVKL
jgi:hypothetical protein